MNQSGNNISNWSSSLMNVTDMSQDKTRFIIIQDPQAKANHSPNSNVPPTIYEWFNIDTPAKALFEFANSFLFQKPNKKDYCFKVILENDEDKVFDENTAFRVRDLSRNHIIELITIPK